MGEWKVRDALEKCVNCERQSSFLQKSYPDPQATWIDSTFDQWQYEIIILTVMLNNGGMGEGIYRRASI